jgi:hypothetical protein
MAPSIIPAPSPRKTTGAVIERRNVPVEKGTLIPSRKTVAINAASRVPTRVARRLS